MSAPVGQVEEPTQIHNLPSTTRNLIGLSQDIAALLSLSIESGASLLHDVYRRTMGTIGLGDVMQFEPVSRAGAVGQGGKGLAVVVVGASEPSGRALSLHLAKTGYTVFSMIPLPSPDSPPTSAALSALLLSWSRIQKRIKTRFPNHPGTIVPITTDPETDASMSSADLKVKGLYKHAGDTIRAYCQESRLVLVAVVCAARTTRPPNVEPPVSTISPPRGRGRVKFVDQVEVFQTPSTPLEATQAQLNKSIMSISRPLKPGSLALTDERTLFSMYRANIVEPLAIIRELKDLLAWAPVSGNGRSRVVFVNGETGVGLGDVEESVVHKDDQIAGATRIIATARTEAAKLLRDDLATVGIDVCEVLVGPMAPRIGASGYHLRHSSDDSTASDSARRRAIENAADAGGSADVDGKEAILNRRLAVISRIWAVDDALLFSAVRRAIEDRYPRYKHHAGLSPLIGTIAEITPGSGIVTMIGRWIVRRLFMPRT